MTVTAGCRDNFDEIKNIFKYDGVLAAAAGNLAACKMACLDRVELCVAFDFSNKCYLHNALSEAAPGNAGSGVTHYVRVFQCNVTTSAGM